MDACGSFCAVDNELKLLVADELLPEFKPNKSNAAELCDADGNWAFTEELVVADELSFALKIKY